MELSIRNAAVFRLSPLKRLLQALFIKLSISPLVFSSSFLSSPTILPPGHKFLPSGSQGFHAQSWRSLLRWCSSRSWRRRVSNSHVNEEEFLYSTTDNPYSFIRYSVVEFSSYDSMQNAVRELDGVDLKGSRVTIREVKKINFWSLIVFPINYSYILHILFSADPL